MRERLWEEYWNGCFSLIIHKIWACVLVIATPRNPFLRIIQR